MIEKITTLRKQEIKNLGFSIEISVENDTATFTNDNVIIIAESYHLTCTKYPRHPMLEKIGKILNNQHLK